MPGQYEPLFAQLAKRFKREEEKTLVKGKQITYVTARTVMNRLDEVLGAENWWDDYAPISGDSILCKLTVRLPDGSTITKADAGGAANMKDAGDDDKSMVSDALKRAAARFGVGRYLYGDGVAPYVKDELTKAAEERKAAKAQIQEATATETAEPQLDTRDAINEAFKTPGPPSKTPQVSRPSNDKEKVKFRGDKIGPAGLDVRFWNKLLTDEVANANATTLKYRLEYDLDAQEATCSAETCRHMVKASTAAGVEDPEPMGPDGKRRRIGLGKLDAHLANLYLDPGWREWMRQELKAYLAKKVRDARQVADNEIHGDVPQDDEHANQETGIPPEEESQLVGAGVENDGWHPGRE